MPDAGVGDRRRRGGLGEDATSPYHSRSLRIFRTTTGWSGAFRDCLRSLPLVAGAPAGPTIISWAAVRARGSGRLLPVRADLVARTVPLRSLPMGLPTRSRKYR